MKEKSIFARIFGSGEKQAVETCVDTHKSETAQAETVVVAEPDTDKAKRNAEFWDMVHLNAGNAHLAAGNMWAKSCGMLEAADRAAYSKALNFMQLIIGTNGELERAKEKFHTDDMFQIFRNLKFDDILL